MDEIEGLGNLSGYMQRGIREGISQRGMWDIIRAADIGISRSVVRQAYNDTRQAMLDQGETAALPWYRIPDATHFSDWRTNNPGKYVYQITLTVVDNDTGEEVERPWTVVSDQPISPQNAIAQATDMVTAGVQSGQYGNEEVAAAELSGLYVTIE